mgnify:CR=1 FL=1|jgi:hypothetical protein
MKKYRVCLEVRTTRFYTVEAIGDVHAIEKAKMLAEEEADVVEVHGGSAELADTTDSETD